jgi:hypothetical protein
LDDGIADTFVSLFRPGAPNGWMLSWRGRVAARPRNGALARVG